MNALSIYTKLETLPPELKKEAYDFIEFLIQKSKNKIETNPAKAVFRSAKGKIHLSKDFDAPIELFNEYM